MIEATGVGPHEWGLTRIDSNDSFSGLFTLAGKMNDDRCRKRLRVSLFNEYLEGRQLLAVSPVQATVSRASIQSPVVVSAAVSPPVASVAVVQTGNPLLGYDFTLIPNQRAQGYDLTQAGRAFGADVPVAGIDVPAGGTLQLQVLTGLTYWSGKGQPNLRR